MTSSSTDSPSEPEQVAGPGPGPPPESGSTRLSGLARHSAIYTAAPLLRQVISIGMTWLYTGWLKGPGFGIKETVDLWMIGLQQLLGQNVLGAMVRFYFDREDERERASVVTSCTIAITALAWVVCGAAFLFAGDLRGLMLGSGGDVTADELETILKLVLVLVPFQLSTLAGFYYLQIQKRSAAYTTLQTVKFVFEIGMNFWLIGALGWGVKGFLLSMLAGEVLMSTFLTGGMLVRLGPRVEWRVLKPILLYAAPLVPVGICQFGLHQLDRRLLLELGGENGAAAQTMTGIYGLGYKVGYLVNAMLLGSFLQIWQPWIYAVKDPDEQGRLVARVSTYCVLAIAAATAGVIVFGREAVAILSGDPVFLPGWQVVPLVASGYVAWALYQVSQIPLFLAKRTGRLFVVNLIALAANVGLNVWLIPRFGFVGAGMATCGTFALLALLGVIASREAAHVPFEAGRLAAALALVAACVAGTFAIELKLVDTRVLGTIGGLAAKAGLFVLIVLGLWRVLRRAERGELITWIAAKIRR